MEYIITSAPAPNFDYVRRAGRNWPKSGTKIEVVEADDDPKQTREGVVIIGKKSWEALKADNRIFARPAGDIEDIAAASVALVEAREKIAALEAENAAFRDDNARLRGVQEPAAAHAKGKSGK